MYKRQEIGGCQLASCIYTFFQPPTSLYKEKAGELCSPAQKKQVLQSMGVEAVSYTHLAVSDKGFAASLQGALAAETPEEQQTRAAETGGDIQEGFAYDD